MTDKEKLSAIKAEIEKRRKLYRAALHDGAFSGREKADMCLRYEELGNMLYFIKFLPEEEPVSEDLEEAGRDWLFPQLDKDYANYGEGKMMELTRFDGYAMLDAIEFGAQWQKQKTIDKACEWLKASVCSYIRVNRKGGIESVSMDAGAMDDLREELEDI